MTCPTCNKTSLCGCGSCKRRRVNLMPLRRTHQWTGGGELMKCPYCRHSFHPDVILDLEYKNYKKQESER